MRVNDFWLGLGLAALGAFALWQATIIPTRPGLVYGPSLFPSLIGIGLIGCGVVITAKHLVLARRRAAAVPDAVVPAEAVPEPDAPRPGWRQLAGIPVIGALVVFYILFARATGFIPAMFVVVAGAALWLRLNWLGAVAAGAATAFGLFVIFALLLRVPLPYGPIERFIW